MSQSRLGSAIETAANIAIGYTVAMVAQIAIFPLFGINIPLRDNFVIGIVFTVVSIVRGYCLRRAFNYWHSRRA